MHVPRAHESFSAMDISNLIPSTQENTIVVTWFSSCPCKDAFQDAKLKPLGESKAITHYLIFRVIVCREHIMCVTLYIV